MLKSAQLIGRRSDEESLKQYSTDLVKNPPPAPGSRSASGRDVRAFRNQIQYLGNQRVGPQPAIF